ncbi:hypothetical protein [Archangium violaceum]|uniref:Uncharacterized protein n=1 Tax=Archangium violaceum Cb vi76 TaxID=1406225 RepID=A0A084SY67_9BACT|nr:hypothetical protein [Archangium violaceum]KFA93402.1 hypothetical protein Q664_09460 [Archangium violaceum Cb vi76]
MSQEAVPVDPHETLYVPMRRRFTREYITTPEGNRELHLFFGIKEITLDEPDLHAFGEALLQQDQFMAGSATTWSGGAPYPWERVRELLEALLAEEILSREAPKPSSRGDIHQRFLEAEALREAPTEPLWWNPDCPRVMERLTGRPLELSFLEAVLPLHRIAHPALDAEGRHVGEMNVFPVAMRMKLPTEWKPCPYPGSRFRDEAMMNVTALRSMTRHWKAVLRGVLAVREEYLRRRPLLPDGRWRVGDLHAVCVAVLALPTLLLMRGNDPVPNGELDPVLSSMFRVTDGVRMVAAYLLYHPAEPRPYDTPITPAELYRISEHENQFLSSRGVCAGPPHMVEEFFATLMDGKPVEGPPAPMPEWAADIPAAVDYAMRGLLLYSLQFNLWGRMCGAYDALRSALLPVEDEPGGFLGRLRARVESDWRMIETLGLNQPSTRAQVESRRVEQYENALHLLTGFREDTPRHLQDAFIPAHDAVDARARLRLRELLRSRADATPEARSDVLGAIADALAEYLSIERPALRALEGIQRQVNALLQRPHPERKFSSADLSLSHRLRIGIARPLPDLMELLRDELEITVENTEETTRITNAPTRSQ